MVPGTFFRHNELLPRQWRQRDIAQAFRDPASVNDRIEGYGVGDGGGF